MKAILFASLLTSVLLSSTIQRDGETFLQIFADKSPQSNIVATVSTRKGKVTKKRCFNTRDNGEWCKFIYKTNDISINGYSDKKSIESINTAINTLATFEMSYGGRYSDIGYSILTLDDGFLLVGSTESYGRGQDNAYVIKVDKFGNKIYEGTYGKEGIDVAKSVVELDDGFMLGGTTRSFGNRVQSLYLARISKDGKLKWQKGYYSDKDDYYTGSDMVKISKNNLLIAGHEEHVEFFDSETDAYVNAINIDGARNGIRRYGGNKVDKINSIISVEDGYVFAGETESWSHGEKDAYVVKLNKDGDIIWDKVFGWNYTEVAQQIIATKDGGYILVGYTDSQHTNQRDALVVKMDKDGNKIWQYHYGSKEHEEGFGIVEADDGFVFVGYTKDTKSYNSDIYLVKINNDGNIMWHKSYGGDGEDKAYAIAKTDDGFVITGYVTSEENFSKDLYLLKVDKNGNLN